MAETQSALRTAVEQVGPEVDSDQDRAFNWLRRTAHERRFFIPRYMRDVDRASPSEHAELHARITAFVEQAEGLRDRRRQRKRAWSTLRHCAGQLQVPEQTSDAYLWGKVVAAVDELVSGGEPSSSREIRDLLLPVIDDMPELPDELPATMLRVLRDLDAYLATRASAQSPAKPGVETSREILEAAELLRGKTVVMIGGERRREHEEALRDAFQLSSLVWLNTREHESISRFAPAVSRPEVAVVLLAIRWSSHSFGEVKHFCDSFGKLLVRLPAGYHPNQVAAQILGQISERLSAA
jgi:hypothetical protein